MYGRPVISQEWSVHAQLTISHSRPNENNAAPDIPPATATASTEHHDPGDVHMEYSWGGQPTSPTPPASSSTNIPPRTCYGFQRGNILFTTRPPPRETQVHKPSCQQTSTSQNRAQNLLDSGYSSEQISPGSYASLPTRRPAQPYSRRCKSTCSIILSGSENQGVTSASMRPNIEVVDSEDSVCYPSGYKCGDPVCYHHQTTNPPALQQVRPKSSDFAPLPETCEVCGGGRSPTAIRRASGINTFTTHFCTRVPERMAREVQDPNPLAMTKPSKDASSQTSDHMATTTAPTIDEKSGLNTTKPSQPKMGNRAYGGFRRKTDTDLLQLPIINIPEPDIEMKKISSGKRLSRSPAHHLSRSPARLRGQSPLAGRKSRGSQCTSTQTADPLDTKGQRKPRTVHIDVYCTGSEDADASGSSDSSDEMSDSWSSPQTVFESEKLKVVHSRVGKERLPVGYLRKQQQQQRQQNVASMLSRRSESFKQESTRTAQQQQEVLRAYDSDDGLSSHYPSQVSSYSTLRGATESSMPQSEVATTTSRGPSWSTISTSSMQLSDEYDSAVATSWKDTTTDLDSLVHSTLSLAQSDSFEYADAADRLRIREKERAWAGTEGKEDSSKTWRSPHLERKHFLQQQKFKEFLEKHLGKSPLPLWKPETTEDSDDDDETGDAWSFCGRDTESSPRPSGSTLKREDTVKRVTPGKDKIEVLRTSPKSSAKSSTFLRPPSRETGSLSDSGPYRYMRRTAIGPFGSKLPSPPPSKVESSVTSPFTTAPGKRTDQLSKAEKFGTIVGAFRKPGHHVGPSKNPECACEHCRRYYEEIGYRTRTRSVGDMPLDDASLNELQNRNGPDNVQDNSTNVHTTALESDLESSITEDASTDNERFVREHISSVMVSEDDDNDD